MNVFRQAADNEVYLCLLAQSAQRAGVDVHAFALMHTHTHLVLTPRAEGALSKMMHRLGGLYGRYFNRGYGRIGTVWNGRYSASLIDTDVYWLTCLRYVEQNPVRAGMVAKPDDYRWSSYPAHAFGHRPDWLVTHPVYEALGSSEAARQKRYRALCGAPLTDEQLAQVRFVATARAALG